jgi:hypothetical protein
VQPHSVASDIGDAGTGSTLVVDVADGRAHKRRSPRRIALDGSVTIRAHAFESVLIKCTAFCLAERNCAFSIDECA